MKILGLLVAGLLFGQLNLQAQACSESYRDVSTFVNESTGFDLKRSKCHKKKKNNNRRSSDLGHIYNYNNFGTPAAVLPGSAFVFNGEAVRSGPIRQTSEDTFTIRRSGHYYVHFVADALYPTTGMGVALELDGEILPPGTPNNFIDTPHILQQIIPVTVSDRDEGSALRVIATSNLPGSSFRFPSGPAVSISILELETNRNN